jgi:hypothetical protein
LEEITQEIRSAVITNRVNLLGTTVNEAKIKFCGDIDDNDLDYSSLLSSVGRELIKSIKIKITVESDEMYADKYRTSA